MPLRSPKWPFTRAAIENSPDEWGGVYVLWRSESIIYIGHAPDLGHGIKADLLAHLSGERGACTRAATHYGWELSRNAKERERELLQEHLTMHRAYPSCNDRR